MISICKDKVVEKFSNCHGAFYSIEVTSKKNKQPDIVSNSSQVADVYQVGCDFTIPLLRFLKSVIPDDFPTNLFFRKPLAKNQVF